MCKTNDHDLRIMLTVWPAGGACAVILEAGPDGTWGWIADLETPDPVTLVEALVQGLLAILEDRLGVSLAF